MVDPKILDKIKKLLRLAKSSNPNEAQAALAHAQRLMLKHNIQAVDDVYEPSIAEEYVSSNTKKPSPRFTLLAVTLAPHFRCRVLSSNTRLLIVGVKEDTEVFIAVRHAAYRYLDDCYHAYRKEHNITDRSVAIKNMYTRGFLRGIDEALTRNEQQYALVVVTHSLVNKKADSLAYGTKSIGLKDNNDLNCYTEGYRAGVDFKSENRLQC